MQPVKTAKEATGKAQTIFLLGRTGSGKTAQILTLPGKKFVYIWEPNALETLRGYDDVDYVEFIPGPEELEFRLKGFNRETLSDRKGSVIEPTIYVEWYEDYVERKKANFFANYDWLCLDSFTFMVAAMIDRQMYLDKRPGEPPDQGDYRVVGDSLRRIVTSWQSMGKGVFLTGHITQYQDDKTKAITIQANLPGQARTLIPLSCTNIWQTEHNGDVSKDFVIRTKSDPRGLKDLRSTVPNLKEFENVTIPVDAKGRFINPQKHGIGALLAKTTPTTTPQAASVVAGNAQAANQQ